ncbi:MAG TPA: NAD(P)H-binding protein [Candidatus Acidoferrales bacterium]|nr:NAD(P)H-binding protein [Candidatus Acidoferrales bacterium]
MSDTQEFDVVTGAFGYTGKYITRRLLNNGTRVRTITGHAKRPHDFGSQVEVAPLDFCDRAGLVQSLQGASVLYNTYWVRFNHRRATFEEAVTNSRVLVQAALDAGVRRIVHLSIANPSLDSHLAYYSGKALVEKAIMDSGLSYAILRPTVIFGKEDILINNIAWFVRHFPVFAVPGSGGYHLQPIFVEDLAELAVCSGRQGSNLVFDIVGPEIFTFEDLVRQIADGVNAKPKLVHVSPWAVFQMLRLVGSIVGDVILTLEEIEGLMANLLVSKQQATGQTRFSAWLSENAAGLGAQYASELQRHYQ